MAKKVEEVEKTEFPKELVHDSGVKVTALNEIQEAAYKNEGFVEVEE